MSTATNLQVQPDRKALALPLVLTLAFLGLGICSRARSNAHLAWTFAGLGCCLLCWQAVLFLQTNRRNLKFEWQFMAVRSHYVQASVQLSIYVYWGWFWRNVYAEAPLILSQVAFLYTFDALLTWSRGQPWRLGFGPWPIVFSTNLFMWFRDDWFVFQFLMVALGVLGKQFIRWERDGKLTHIFNPSAFALTVVSLALLFTGTTRYTWGVEIAVTQGRPPLLYTEIFLCGLIVQYFFSVTLMTFSAAAALGLLALLFTKVTGVYVFVDSNIPIAVFLGLHLLMTDPATTPRSSLGRIAFGGLYGAGVLGAYILLREFGAPEFYDKLVVVPVLNLLTPLLDRWATAGAAAKRFANWEALAGPRKANLLFMGGWVALFLFMLISGFVQAPHPGATIAFWKKAAEEKRPYAAQNLRLLLEEFERSDMGDPSLDALAFGPKGPLSREQALGILCNQVGTIYDLGQLVPPDLVKAAHFYQRACDLGNADGCANLVVTGFRTNLAGAEAAVEKALSSLEQSGVASTNGRMRSLIGLAYEQGKGRPLDKVKARDFYETASNLGDLTAWRNLARMQLGGEGGPPDHESAARWLQKAADAQDGPSCLLLARMYHNGDGVPKDETKAVALLDKACKLGVEPACLLLRQSAHR